MPGQPIPFRWIRGLPAEAQKDIERNFLALQQQITATAVYDVYVNPSNAVDNVGALTFTTPFAAIKYAADTLGKSVINVGWINNNGGTATETGNYSGTNTPTWVTVEVIGAPATNLTGRGNTGQPTWALAGFTDNGKIPGLAIVGLHLSVTTNRTTAPIGATQMFSKWSFIQGGSGSTTQGFALPSGAYFDTNFSQCTFINDSGGHLLQNCQWDSQTLTSFSTPARFMAYNCRFTGGSSALTTWTASGAYFILADCAFDGANASGSTINLTVNTSTGFVYITTTPYLASGAAAGTHCGLNVAGSGNNCTIEGAFRFLTVAGQSGCTINAYVIAGAADITGPVAMNLTCTAGGHTLRGAGITGTISTTASSGTNLSFVSVVRSALIASFNNSGTAKAYAIDAGSGPGIMIEEGESGGSTGSTNAGTNFLVINHSGAPPSGAASGSLSGSYPSPIFAGRDSSVDALNKDLLPSLLGGDAIGVFGVIQYPPAAGAGAVGGSLAGSLPNPTFAGRDASVDEINKDLLPSLLVP